MGDGFMAVFPGAAEAIAAAAEIQRKISSRNESSDVGFDVRIGVSAGDVAKRAGDYHGLAAVEAARLCAAAAGGQILASETVRVLAGSRGGHDFVALGELDLKGLPPVAAVAVRWSEAAPVAVATRRARGVRRRLPAVGRLLGRDRELESLARALEAGGPVLVLGPGGIGKSTLCRAVLRQAAMPTLGLAGWFIRCDGLTDSEAVVSAIGRELAIAPGPNLLNRMLDGLASTPGVLVLDNAETPWQADTAGLEELLEELADIDALRLVVAMRLGVPPIRPSWAHVERVGPLEPEPAAALFATIAGISNDVDSVASLIAAVDRVPLAVELLANAARTEPSLDRLATRWRLERAGLLDRGVGAADPRLSVPASVELSWKGAFMGVDAQRVGALLALAPAGLSLVDLDRAVPDGAALARRGYASRPWLSTTGSGCGCWRRFENISPRTIRLARKTGTGCSTCGSGWRSQMVRPWAAMVGGPPLSGWMLKQQTLRWGSRSWLRLVAWRREAALRVGWPPTTDSLGRP